MTYVSGIGVYQCLLIAVQFATHPPQDFNMGSDSAFARSAVDARGRHLTIVNDRIQCECISTSQLHVFIGFLQHLRIDV
jgi:hypothetical protein